MQCRRTMTQLTKKKSWARKQYSYAYIYKIYLDVDLSHKFNTLKRIYLRSYPRWQSLII